MSEVTSARYRFGDGMRVGVLLGLSLRQSIPIVLGVLWLTLCLMAQLPLIGMLGPAAGCVVAFGRWRRAPLIDVVVPGTALEWRRFRRRRAWVRTSLIASPATGAGQLPTALAGLELLDVTAAWPPGERQIGVISDRHAGTISMVVAVTGVGFPVASCSEQDALLAAWGNALAPLARARSAVSRVTWQEWTHPVGVAGHHEFLARRRSSTPHTLAHRDYDTLLDEQAPFTTAHDVVVTLTVDRRRLPGRQGGRAEQLATETLVDEMRQMCARLHTAGLAVSEPWTSDDVAHAVRLRSDPYRLAPRGNERVSLAAASGRTTIDWGPMAVEPDWFDVRIDGAFHRSYVVANWPLLPVAADWLAPLLTVDGVTRTVTVVLEPVPLLAAVQDANRQLTTLEADQGQKERHGFRLTARERRRHDDAAIRERELAEGHPLFRHVAFVTVTAPVLSDLDHAASRVEQAAAQSMLDLRPLAARQAEGWCAALPLGRSAAQGRW